MDLPRVARLIEIVAAIVAVLLARRRAEHRPAAVALVVFTLADALRLPVDTALPWSEAPYAALGMRALVYLDTALVLAMEAVLPTLAVVVCSERPKRPLVAMVAAWAAVSVGCAVLYPSPMVRGDGLARVYLAADLAGLFVTIVAFVQWARRRESPSSSHVVALLLMAADVVVLLVPFSPWRAGIFQRWDTAQFALVLLFFTLTLYQGGLRWRSSAS